MKYSGQLHKMKVSQGTPISYTLELDQPLDMNDLIDHHIQLKWTGEIQCVACGKKTKKSFNQGFCYSCFQSAPEAAECIIRPELCKAHLGVGRDTQWEEDHHNQPHAVYLAATDVIKVGVTRSTQIPTRWIDQGASSAIVLALVPYRQLAGVLEVELKNQFTDKTNWQKMLKNETDESIDLVEAKWSLEEVLPSDLLEYFSEDDHIYEFDYPVLQYPEKVKSLDFEKDPIIEKKLKGIKGQYLIFEDGSVINIRKFSGYLVEISILD